MYTPLVTVITPFHNAEKTIVRSLKSVVSLKYRPLEVVLVDDASTDSGSELVRNIITGNTDKALEIKLIRLPENGGVSAARNAALMAASGEYITAVDADDYIDPEAVNEYVAATENGGIDIVAAGVYYEYPARCVPYHFKSGERLTLGEVTIDSLHFLLTNKLIRTEALRSVSPFLPGQNCWEDLGAVARMLAAGAKTKVLHGAWYHYVQESSGSLTRSDPDIILAQHLAVTRSLEQWMQEHGYAGQNAGFLDYLKFISKVKYLRNYPQLMRHPMARLRAWRDCYPEVNGKIMSFSKVALHYRLLFQAARVLAALIPQSDLGNESRL